MTTRQHSITRTGRWIAMLGVVSAAGLVAWGAASTRAQTVATTQPAAAPAAPSPAPGVTPPAPGLPTVRPANMAEYEQRRAAALARAATRPAPTAGPVSPVRPGGPVTTTRPAGSATVPPTAEMHLEADQIEAVGDERLKELERAAAADAGAPNTPPTPTPPVLPGQSTHRPGVNPQTHTPPTPPRIPNGPMTRPAGATPNPGLPGARTPGGTPPNATPQPGTEQPGSAGPSALTPSGRTHRTAVPQPTVPNDETHGDNPAEDDAEAKAKQAISDAANPMWWKPAEERPYFLSWSEVTFRKTLQDLCDMTGLTVATSMVPPTDLDGKKITFQSVRLMTFDEALTLYNTLIFDMNYWLVRQKDYLVVRQLTEWYRRITPDHMFPSTEAYYRAKLPKWEVATVVYAPQYQTADYLANFAMDYVPLNGARATALPNSGGVHISGFVYFIDDQLEIIKGLDVKEPGEGTKPLRTYQLQYASVEDAARMLRAMLPQSATMGPSVPATPPAPGAPGGARPPSVVAAGDEVEIQEDTRGDRLLVKATPAKHDLVKEYLEKYIDLPLPETSPVELFEIQHADPDQLVDMIKPLLGKTQTVNVPVNPNQPQPPPQPPGRGGRPPQQILPTVTVGTSATLVSFPQSRSILAKANRDEMAQIKRYIKLLDIEGEKNFEYKLLKKASAASVCSVLNQVLGGGRRPGLQGPGQVQFTATPDASNDKGLIIKGEPQDLTDAKKIIEELDLDPDADAIEHLVQLKDADPSNVADVLRSRFSDSGGGGGSRRGPSYGPYGYNPYGGGSSGGGGSSLPRFITDTTTKMLIVMSTAEMWPDIDRLIKELDEKSQTRNVTKVYHLKHVAPSSMVEILAQAFAGMGGGMRRMGYYPGMSGGEGSDRPSFQYAPDSDALIITATDEMHTKAADLITQLDQPGPTDQAQPRPIQLVKADPEYVANKIEEYFQGSGGSGRRGGYSPFGGYSPYGGGGASGGDPHKIPVRVVAEEMTNRVFVTASDEDFKTAEGLAQSIDAEYEKAEIVRETFVLEHADPAEVRNILESMFPEDMASGSRRRRRSFDYSDYSDYGDFGGGRRNSGGTKPNAIRLIETSDSLIAIAPKAKMEQIANAIKELDTDGGENQIKTYKVENAGSEGTADIARQLTELFSDNRGGGGDWGGQGRSRAKIKFMGDHGSDVLLVSAPAKRMPEIDQRVQEILKLKTPADLSFVFKHFDVKAARPEDVADMIEPFLAAKFQELRQKSGRSGGGWGGWGGNENSPRVIAQKNVSRIMVSAPETLMPLVQELLTEFDQPRTPSTTKLVTLQTGKASEVAQAVEEMMSADSNAGRSFRSGRRGWQGGWDGGGWGGGWGGGGRSSASLDDGELHMTAIDASNIIILRGPMERVDQAEGLIKQVDAQAITDKPTINVFKIQHANLYDVADMIETFVGGGEDSYYSRSTPKDVTVKTDYTTNSLIVSATRDKLPMIKQIIEMRDQPPPPPTAVAAGQMGKPVPGYDVGRGEIAKSYDIAKGDVNETSKKLDEILLKEYGYDAPYVKAFPFANQIIVSGKPEHFTEVERWLKEFEKHPIEAKYVVSILPTKQSPEEVVKYLKQALSTEDLAKLEIQPTRQLGENDPLNHLEEVKWNTPVQQPPSTQPAGSVMAQPADYSPFVPTGELSELRASVAALRLTQVRVTAITRPIADSRPADSTPSVRVTPVTTEVPDSDLQVLARPTVLAPTTAPTTQPAPLAPAPAVSVSPNAAAAVPLSGPDRERQMAVNAALEARETGKVQIRFDNDTKTIYIVGPDLAVENYKKLIEDIESSLHPADEASEPGLETQIRVFRLKDIDVNIAAAILEQMFNDKVATPVPAQPGQPPQPQPQPNQANKPNQGQDDEENSSRRRRREDAREAESKTNRKGLSAGQRIRVFADARTSTIIVRAVPEDFRAVAELILKIDRPGMLPAMEIKVFQLRQLNAADVEMAIKEVLKIEDPRTRMMMGGRSPYSRMGMGGMGMNDAEALIEQLQAQMMQVEMQANLAGVNTPQPGAEGAGKQYKLNPSKDISVTSDSTTNTVIVTAPREGMSLVEKLINTLEDQTIPMQIKSFPLKFASAEQVSSQLEELFQSSSGGGGGRRSRGGPGGGGFGGMGFGGFTGFEGQRSSEIRITADTRTNTVFVKALALDMDKIESMISEIDQEGLGTKIMLYRVQSGDADAIAKALTDTFSERGQGGSGQAVHISAVANASTIVVRAPEAVQARIGEKIKEIDHPLPPPKQIVVKNVSASAVADQIEAIYLGQGGRRGPNSQVRIEGDDNSGTIFISAPEEMYKQIAETIKVIDQPTRQEIHVYKLQYATATDVLTSFREMITQLMQKNKGSGNVLTSEPVAASADPKSNSLIVTGSPSVHMVVATVLTQIDVPSAMRSAMVQLKYARAEELAPVLQQTFQASRTGRDQAISVNADPNTNTLLITAGFGDMEGVKDFITKLDAPATLPDEELRIIPLANLDATETLKIMTEYLRLNAARGGANAQLTGGVRLQASATMNALIVSGTEAQIKQIEAKVRGMDAEGGIGQRFKIIPINRGVDIKEFATRVERLFNEGLAASATPGTRANKISVEPDYSGPSLIVTGSPQVFPDVEKLVQQLAEQQPNGFNQTAVFIRLKNTRSQDAMQVIKNISPENGSNR